MLNDYLAHIKVSPDGQYSLQSLQKHGMNTAEYASCAVKAAGLSHAAYYAGMLHDMGKARREYQIYLRDAVEGKPVKRGSVNHSFAAVRYCLSKHHCDGSCDTAEQIISEKIVSELLAFAMGAHHGVFDLVDKTHQSGFWHRLQDEHCGYEEASQSFFKVCWSENEESAAFDEAANELTAAVEKIMDLAYAAPEPSSKEISEQDMTDDCAFYLSLLARLLLSAVIEGDHRDTAEFMNGISYQDDAQDKADLWKQRAEFLEKELEKFRHDSSINRARQTISDQCMMFAQKEGGIYRLNVPTGAGKTLSSLRFALHHAHQWNKSRIIYVTPLISILEQNAEVIKRFIGDETLVLEYHSNVIRETSDPDGSEDSGINAANLERLTENWHSPVVITTLVQFLNTFFSHKASAIRRFHSLCGSVIIIDEVQTVPLKMLSLFNLAISFLKEVCHATIVMCSATQPCLESAEHPICQIIREDSFHPCRIRMQDMVPYDRQLWGVFKRTEIVNAGSMNQEALVTFAYECLASVNSLLIICNTKKEAEEFFEAIKKDSTFAVFHLSAGMCMAHRRDVMTALYSALQRGRKKVVCISTQVIEAGVDISFEGVIRLCAGMDSIIQSAGRCNRNGELNKVAQVQVVRLEGENLRSLEHIRMGKDATNELFAAFRNEPERFGWEYSSDEAISMYYEKLYGLRGKGYQNYVIESGPNKGQSIFKLLAENNTYAAPDAREMQGYPYFLKQAFKAAGNNFRVIDNNTTDILVPYGKGKTLITELSSLANSKDYIYLKRLISQAKEYSVSVYQYQVTALEKQGAIISLFNGEILILTDGFYDDDAGLCLEGGRLNYMEVSD